MALKRGLDPVVDDESRVLIPGSVPGDESLRLEMYYAHPRNQFWSILGDVYATRVPSEYEHRLRFLRERGVALWDVLESASRVGSLDSAITEGAPNDLIRLLAAHPRLRAIGFNGTEASTLFRRHVPRQKLGEIGTVKTAVLPSTSPTPGRNVQPYAEKVTRWRRFLSR